MGLLCETKEARESWVWWHRPGTPALEKLRQEDQMLEASLSYAVSLRQVSLG